MEELNPKKTYRKKKKPDAARWPTRILAFLVLGTCVFVAATSSHLLVDGMAGWNPLDFSTYGPARDSVDAAYTSHMFSRRQQPAEPGSAAQPGPHAQQGQQHQPEALAEEENPIRDALVDINGLATGGLGARELNGVAKLDNGYITAVLDEAQDQSFQIEKTVEFYEFAQSHGKRFVFVMAPHLVDKYDPKLPVGVADNFNQSADALVAGLQGAGVPTIDLRDVMHAEGFDHYGGFFRTDHHWTPNAAAWAVDRVVRALDEWGWLDTEGIAITPDDFEAVHEGVRFYGTAAERTGPAFAGEPDTLPCVVPKADVPAKLRWKHYETPEDGYGDAYAFETLYRDWQYADYENIMNPDAYYLYKTMYEATVLNEAAPVNNHLMLVSDSFGVPFQSFAACYMREITAFEGRWHVDFEHPVKQSDIVMVLYNPSSLDIRSENATSFNFR